MKNISPVKATTLNTLSPLFDLGGCTWFSLQKSLILKKAAVSSGKLIDWSDAFQDFDDALPPGGQWIWLSRWIRRWRILPVVFRHSNMVAQPVCQRLALDAVAKTALVPHTGKFCTRLPGDWGCCQPPGRCAH